MDNPYLTDQAAPASLAVSASVAVVATLLVWLGLDWQSEAVLTQAEVVLVVLSTLWGAFAYDVYVRVIRARRAARAMKVARLSLVPSAPRPSRTPEPTRFAA